MQDPDTTLGKETLPLRQFRLRCCIGPARGVRRAPSPPHPARRPEVQVHQHLRRQDQWKLEIIFLLCLI